MYCIVCMHIESFFERLCPLVLLTILALNLFRPMSSRYKLLSHFRGLYWTEDSKTNAAKCVLHDADDEGASLASLLVLPKYVGQCPLLMRLPNGRHNSIPTSAILAILAVRRGTEHRSLTWVRYVRHCRNMQCLRCQPLVPAAPAAPVNLVSTTAMDINAEGKSAAGKNEAGSGCGRGGGGTLALAQLE